MKTIITIGRQFGSGGKEVGIRVAKELGIPFYDKEILQEAAKKSGLCEKILENFDERPKSLLYSIAMDSYMFALPGTGAGESLEQQVYLATFNTIRHIAEEGPCVIIGRGLRPGQQPQPFQRFHPRPPGGPNPPGGPAAGPVPRKGQDPDQQNGQAPGLLL